MITIASLTESVMDKKLCHYAKQTILQEIRQAQKRLHLLKEDLGELELLVLDREEFTFQISVFRNRSNKEELNAHYSYYGSLKHAIAGAIEKFRHINQRYDTLDVHYGVYILLPAGTRIRIPQSWYQRYHEQWGKSKKARCENCDWKWLGTGDTFGYGKDAFDTGIFELHRDESPKCTAPTITHP